MGTRTGRDSRPSNSRGIARPADPDFGQFHFDRGLPERLADSARGDHRPRRVDTDPGANHDTWKSISRRWRSGQPAIALAGRAAVADAGRSRLRRGARPAAHLWPWIIRDARPWRFTCSLLRAVLRRSGHRPGANGPESLSAV